MFATNGRFYTIDASKLPGGRGHGEPVRLYARKGKQVLNVKPPDAARAIAVVDGEMAAAVGENRKMVIFPLDQVPEMARGRGVRLQRHKDGGLSDVTTFKGSDGLNWVGDGGRVSNLSLKELAAWRGNRGDAGRVRPDRFLANLKFGRLAENACRLFSPVL